MTAPAAPVIRARTNGLTIRVLWQPVPNATDYKLYVGPASAPTGLEADIPDDDIGDDGWFQYTFFPDDVTTYIRLTALNVGAEESAYSNQLKRSSDGGGVSFGFTGRQPFGG